MHGNVWMRCYRSALPPILGIRDSQSCRLDLSDSKCSPRLPSFDPSPREIYGERELLMEQKFLLLNEIHQLRTEVSALGAYYQKTVAAYNAQQQFEVDQARMNNAAAESHRLTARQAAIQRQYEELEDRLLYLMRYFSAEAAEQIRVEVAVEKHAVKRIRAQLEAFAATRQDLTDRLNSEALRLASEKVGHNTAEIESLTSILNDLKDQWRDGDAEANKETDSEKRKGEQEQEIEGLAQQLKDLKTQKFAKQKQRQNLAHSIEAEQQAALNDLPYKMLRERSAYNRQRFRVSVNQERKTA